MEKRMKILNQKVHLTTSDSGYISTSQSNWIPRGTMSILFGKWTNIVNAKAIFKDPT